MTYLYRFRRWRSRKSNNSRHYHPNPDPTLEPIEQLPLRLRVAERLRSAIVTGKLRPGDSLTETALAVQLNVSRAPIREAIQDLENDGLVETVPYKGKRVKPLTVQEVIEICDMRQYFEVMAVRRIVEDGTEVVGLWGPCREMVRRSVTGKLCSRTKLSIGA